MRNVFNRFVRAAFNRAGYEINRRESDGTVLKFPPDFDQSLIDLYRSVRPFTMTSMERVAVLRDAVRYIVNANVPGDIVECGVWRGGSMMAVAQTLQELGCTHRTLHLFDTFEGMTAPTENDVRYTGETASELLSKVARNTSDHLWAFSPIEHVRENLARTNYPSERIRFVKGRVEETLPDAAPAQIALLRLDTDWYASTYHELTHLYPRLAIGGVLIIDDYGHWKGQHEAVDRYVAERKLRILLNRIDFCARVAIKLEA